jgi:hypothetical protein
LESELRRVWHRRWASEGDTERSEVGFVEVLWSSGRDVPMSTLDCRKTLSTSRIHRKGERMTDRCGVVIALAVVLAMVLMMALLGSEIPQRGF